MLGLKRCNRERMVERRILSLAAVCLCWFSLLVAGPVGAFSVVGATSRSVKTRVRLASVSLKEQVNTQQTVVIAGATGYIGRAVVKEAVKRGYQTVALVRNLARLQTEEGQAAYADCFQGATVMECNVQDKNQVEEILSELSPDTIISCLASPSGTKKDAYAIDYQASSNFLRAGQQLNAKHFVLLSAFCCRKPLLQLQQAKLKLEAEIQAQSDMTYSIVRPTAFFKSVSGQLEAIQKGAPYVLFDDGAVTRCNPIAESDLAEYVMNTLGDDSKKNRILNVGGPDHPLTNKDLGEMMFKAISKEPKFVYAPTFIFDPIIHTLEFIAAMLRSESLKDAAETGRIGKYYAVEDMLTTDPAEKYGKITMQDHYNRIAAKGQDPFTPVRATAVIGRAIEALPVIFCTALPAAFALANPAIGEGMGQIDVSLLLAELTSGKL